MQNDNDYGMSYGHLWAKIKVYLIKFNSSGLLYDKNVWGAKHHMINGFLIRFKMISVYK